MKKVALLSLFLSVMGCEVHPIENPLNSYSGSYQLEQAIIASGPEVDLNRDGKASSDLLSEFRECLSYDEKWTGALFSADYYGNSAVLAIDLPMVSAYDPDVINDIITFEHAFYGIDFHNGDISDYEFDIDQSMLKESMSYEPLEFAAESGKLQINYNLTLYDFKTESKMTVKAKYTYIRKSE